MRTFIVLALFCALFGTIRADDEQDDIDVGDIKIASRAFFTYTEGFGCVEGRESPEWCEEYAYGELEVTDKSKFYNLGERVFCDLTTTENKPETREPVHVRAVAGALWIQKAADSPNYIVSGLLVSKEPVEEGVQIYGLEGKTTRMYLDKYWEDGLFNFQRMEVKIWGEKQDQLKDLVEDQVAPTLRKFKELQEQELHETEASYAGEGDAEGTEIL
mmetsp:Transcript_1558/g.2062  ORF Transcript_1558/g.2062 Transcript_1558/m.2062 type:complete len:216 (+) Transcript_1558:187-834(+)